MKSKEKQPRRIFVCDPIMFQEYGHPFTAGLHFKNFFCRLGYEAEVVGCRRLPDAIAGSEEVVRAFSFHYGEYFLEEISDQIIGDLHAAAEKYADEFDYHTASIKEDVWSLISKFDVGENDVLFFPGVDFYSILGTIFALSELPSGRSRPAVHFRFIGVLEFTTKIYDQARAVVKRTIQRALSEGLRLTISAETPRYATQLSGLFDANIYVLPYPETHAHVPVTHTTPRHFSLPGSGRIDKGLLQARILSEAVSKRNAGDRVTFSLQSPPYFATSSIEEYLTALYADPDVHLLPPSISTTQMQNMIAQSRCVILPYDRATYADRGSAVFMEAIYAGRPVVTYNGTAFAQQIDYYGAGVVASNDDEFADAIVSYLDMSTNEINRKAEQARMRLLIDTQASYVKVLEDA